MIQKPKILVTGGAGYIGSHTCKALYQQGYEPVVLDNFSTGHRSFVKWGPLIEGDIADSQVVKETLKKYDIQAVIHFAAHSDVGESVKNPRKYFENNVMGSLHLLHAMLDVGVKKFVLSSTCATYGMPQQVPIPDNHPQNPINPYGDSKLFIEKILYWYGKQYDFKWMALRYFNAAGADPDAEIGEQHNPETHLIPLVIQAALGKIPQIQVYGTDYPTADGTAIRDYVHVKDLAKAHIMALDYLDKGGDSCGLNLGTGKGYSVLEVIQTVEKVAGRSFKVEKTQRREGDPPVLVAKLGRTKEKLGWEAMSSDIHEIISDAWNWHSKS